jgi:leucyl-tRNA synthetase
MILAPDGQKMSKSKGNVINPDSVVKNVGSDSLRVYEMFMGPFDQAISWSEDGVAGSRRFLERVWRLMLKTGIEDKKILKEKIPKEQKNAFEVLLNQAIKKVTDNIESMKFNTAVSQLMILTNEAEKMPFLSKDQLAIIIKLLSVFAPHITEEMWSMLKLKGTVHELKWPKYNPKKLIKETVEIGVTIDGKLRGTIILPMNCGEDEAVSVAKNTPEIMKFIENRQIIRVVFKANKILNFVTS